MKGRLYLKMDMGGFLITLFIILLVVSWPNRRHLKGSSCGMKKTPWDYVNEEENLGLLLFQERK